MEKSKKELQEVDHSRLDGPGKVSKFLVPTIGCKDSSSNHKSVSADAHCYTKIPYRNCLCLLAVSNPTKNTCSVVVQQPL